ncbi:unnamed protein product, partial [Brenthis ino]
MSLFDNAVFNSTLYEALYLQIEDTLGFAKNFFESCVSSLPIENLPKTFVNLSELSFYDEIAESVWETYIRKVYETGYFCNNRTTKRKCIKT